MHDYRRHQKRMARRRHQLRLVDLSALVQERHALGVIDADGMAARVVFNRAFTDVWLES